jgi:hypothetical protein
MDEGYDCYGCHDLSWAVGGGEPLTSWLSGTNRNIGAIKTANGGVPTEFGCLYCHNNPGLKDDPDTIPIESEYRMRDASGHFRSKASAHPVGYNLTTMADTSGHLLSTFDMNAGNNTNGGFGDRLTELDCVDCHDVTDTDNYLGYPQHGTPKATNPYLLRSVGVFNLSAATKEYDGVCRR